jgi:hypothetical protein
LFQPIRGARRLTCSNACRMRRSRQLAPCRELADFYDKPGQVKDSR